MAERFPPISPAHDCSRFDCGDIEINRYLQRHALTNHKRGIAKTFVAVAEDADLRVVGYYSISPTQIDVEELPRSMSRSLPGYPLGGYRMGRLGVALEAQGQGLGADLVFAAAARAVRASESVGGAVLLIDAKSASLAEWYRREFRGFPLNSHPNSLVIPLNRIRDALDS